MSLLGQRATPASGSALARRRRSRSRQVLYGVRSAFGRNRRIVVVLVWGLAALVVAVIIMGGLDIYRASVEGRSGERALFAAVSQFDAAASEGGGGDSAHLEVARADLARARADFDSAHMRLSGAWLAPARLIPFVRIQVRGADHLSQAGIELSAAGENLATVASGLLSPADPNTPLKDALGQLRPLDSAAAASMAALQEAESQVYPLSGYRLIGPVASARSAFFAKLPHVEQRVFGGDQALRAFEDFLGAAGPRQYLFFTQNPDEVRPTGGFLGTYGLLAASKGHLTIENFGGDMHEFLGAYPDDVVAETQAPTVFQIAGSDQTIANVNASPDWPTAAQLAVKLWKQAGQPSVNGVMSLTPSFLTRLVGILGPVTLPDYGVTINASNLQAQVDYWAHQNPTGLVGRQAFFSELAKLVLQETLDAPATKWKSLALATSAGFDASEAMFWSSDATLQTALAAHNWDHAFPQAGSSGDFYYDSEFAYASKNGSGLQRVFQHTVQLKADGSGVASTSMDITDSEPVSDVNGGIPDYVVGYGPGGATLDQSVDPPYYPYESSVAGHPAAGWIITPNPGSKASMTARWRVPHLLRHVSGNVWAYSLKFYKLAGHSGDVLKLNFVLPPGWHWKGNAPPATIPLTNDVHSTWYLVSP